MKIICLTENTQGSTNCGYEHGLCIYIETKKHKILVDTGTSDLLLKNAEILGIDLTQVDTVVLSHGHYDHSGGIMPFAEINSHANIYVHRHAGDDYYHGERYIGIDKRILSLPQVIFTESLTEIDTELSIFSKISGSRCRSKSNLPLTKKCDGKDIQDSFDHEQCLVINAEGEIILVSGCAHNGILNILDKFRVLYDCDPDIVISGFHMMKKTELDDEDVKIIKETAHELAKMHTVFWSGHCTGKPAFDIMKEIMGNQLCEMHSGDIII